LRRAACRVGEWRGAAVCVSLYDDTNTILRFHSTESDESSGALWCFLVGQLGGICRGQRGSRHHCTMRRFSTESTVRRSSSRHDTRVDEAAMQAKLKELRGLMASEHAARETVLDMATLNGGSIWQTSRRPEERGRAEPIRPSVGVSGGRGGRTAQPHRTGPRLRDLSAEDMSLVERARMRASTDANARPSSHASRRPGHPGEEARGVARVVARAHVGGRPRPPPPRPHRAHDGRGRAADADAHREDERDAVVARGRGNLIGDLVVDTRHPRRKAWVPACRARRAALGGPARTARRGTARAEAAAGRCRGRATLLALLRGTA
jgi:hypothetical protein